jgi:16S rRNA (guanine(966)-N(2))-methyltransferase RsmD
MHILAGKYRNRYLVKSPSPKVRPTARRLREALFEVIGDKIVGASFLDLCAGTGTVGLEALSRGASHVTFVERSPRFASLLQQNLHRCLVLKREAEVVVEDGEPYLQRSAKQEKKWDIVFLDPPYEADYTPLLNQLAENRLLRDGGLIVTEHHAEKEMPDAIGNFKLASREVAGESGISFYKANG